MVGSSRNRFHYEYLLVHCVESPNQEGVKPTKEKALKNVNEDSSSR